MNVQSVITLEQAQNEIDALQRRLAEYASEVQRLREQGRDCYVDADSKSTLNALEECRLERDKLKEGGKQIAEGVDAIRMSIIRWQQLWVIQREGLDHLDRALTKARELGLLEDK
jgi:uncharacterized coiled-coil DUF342 family protein